MAGRNATLSKKLWPGEAFAYVLNPWDALCYCCDDGLAEPDNDVAEQALHAVCPGKRNDIFFGGERGALLYELIGTCNLNGIDMEAYPCPILSVLLEWPGHNVAELLPWNVDLISQ
jgi:transposase